MGAPFVSCIVVGPPRSGKSATVSALAIKALRSGERVVSNLPFDPKKAMPEVRVVDMRHFDIETGAVVQPEMSVMEANAVDGPVFFKVNKRSDAIGLKDSVWLMDEAQVDTNARDWETMTERDRLFFSMFGHWRVVIVLFTQHLKFIDVLFRREVEEVRSVSKALFGRFVITMAHYGFNEETCELGPGNIFTLTAMMRPKGDLDHMFSFPGLVGMLRLGKDAFASYRTHAPRDTSIKLHEKTPKK